MKKGSVSFDSPEINDLCPLNLDIGGALDCPYPLIKRGFRGFQNKFISSFDLSEYISLF